MAVGQTNFPKIHSIPGIKLGTACAGIKQTEKPDLLIVEMAQGSTCAGVFTQNAFCAAPVIVARNNLLNQPLWLLVNSGNANAGTGKQGMQDTLSTCAELGTLQKGKAEQVLPFSTGVIGETLPVAKITHALPEAVANLTENNWENAAHAIMTTDTFAKGATQRFNIDGKSITLSGISKGAGMIQPNMATMLAFIATDAKISPDLLQNCLGDAVEKSFNRITVDSDTSTNDSCILMASGQSEAKEILEEDESYYQFIEALNSVCRTLAEAIVRDGEGATKLIRIDVKKAKDSAEALLVAKTVAHSPLVKTAFFASDPNWGRILAAVGRAGVRNMQVEKIVIYLGDVCIVEHGARAESYTEQAGQEIMKQEEITLTISLGRGNAEEQILTCDFSYDYVKINAEYRT